MNTERLDDLLNFICEYSNITIDQFKSKSRRPVHLLPRQMFCYFAYKNRLYFNNSTLSYLGEYLNGRDHTTIRNSVIAIQNYLDTNNESIKAFYKHLCSNFDTANLIYGSFKNVKFKGFKPFTSKPSDDLMIEVKNGVPFAIGLYNAEKNTVTSGYNEIEITSDLEWRPYVI